MKFLNWQNVSLRWETNICGEKNGVGGKGIKRDRQEQFMQTHVDHEKEVR